MSTWYAAAVALTFNDTVSPGFTLIAVENPCSAASPDPVTCQSARGSPGCEFSQAMMLVTGGPHTPAAEAGVGVRPRMARAAIMPIVTITAMADLDRPPR